MRILKSNRKWFINHPFTKFGPIPNFPFLLLQSHTFNFFDKKVEVPYNEQKTKTMGNCFSTDANERRPLNHERIQMLTNEKEKMKNELDETKKRFADVEAKLREYQTKNDQFKQQESLLTNEKETMKNELRETKMQLSLLEKKIQTIQSKQELRSEAEKTDYETQNTDDMLTSFKSIVGHNSANHETLSVSFKVFKRDIQKIAGIYKKKYPNDTERNNIQFALLKTALEYTCFEIIDKEIGAIQCELIPFLERVIEDCIKHLKTSYRLEMNSEEEEQYTRTAIRHGIYLGLICRLVRPTAEFFWPEKGDKYKGREVLNLGDVVPNEQEVIVERLFFPGIRSGTNKFIVEKAFVALKED